MSRRGGRFARFADRPLGLVPAFGVATPTRPSRTGNRRTGTDSIRGTKCPPDQQFFRIPRPSGLRVIPAPHLSRPTSPYGPCAIVLRGPQRPVTSKGVTRKVHPPCHPLRPVHNPTP